jgi:hypothetical protein
VHCGQVQEDQSSRAMSAPVRNLDSHKGSLYIESLEFF